MGGGDETDSRIVRPRVLGDFMASVFAAKGMSDADARIFADIILWANLRGIDTHGAIRLPMYVRLIDNGALDAQARPAVRTASGAILHIDANRAAGQIALAHATNLAVAKAKAFGIAMALVSDTTHTGAAGYYAQKAAQQGCIAIVTSASVPLMAYHGAAAAGLGTSPLAIAAPRKGGGVINFDMASSTGSFGKLQQARLEGKPIPADWALDEQGKPTTDAKKAAVLLPLGGAKGSGLALMVEMLNSLLAAEPILASMAGTFGGSRHVQNASIIAIDIEAFRPAADYAADAEELARALTSLPRAEGFEEIRMPGDRGAATAAERETAGIPISGALWRELEKVAGNAGVPPLEAR